ncbi:MAG: hypothetical protein M0P71_16620 [Melioribacteraceae bacterium]|nr:hypothetical protein [Melioribacteraceae bacterium]
MENHKKKIFIIFIILIIISGIIGWYYYEESLWYNPDNQYIYRIKKKGKRVFVVLNNKHDLCEVCDCMVLDGKWPVSSLEKAINIFGEPDNYITENNGNQKIEYWADNGRVVFLKENIYDGTEYTLSAFPNNYLYSDFFIYEISKLIDPERDETIVCFNDKKDDELFSVIIIKGKRVDEFSCF